MSELKVDLSNLSIADRKDIRELRRNIQSFQLGEMNEEKFKHYRLTRGVYGQRQLGAQMFRIKIPYGKLTAAQLTAIADLSDAYSNGNLHLTTRQNIQLHHLRLEDSPKVWEALAAVGLTARESCGNTVRNLTAAAMAGVDPYEPFDVSPYVHALFEYFLRNPICQDMGRKIKPAFSSSEQDKAFTYFHDLGYIPRVKVLNYKEQRGFKVVIGGGLGAQAIAAQTVYEFLPEDQLIPFSEAVIRVFDRYGEREKRHKARLKFLIKQLGLEQFMELLERERQALPYKSLEIDRTLVPQATIADVSELSLIQPNNYKAYAKWIKSNVVQQKQYGYYAVQLKVTLGDLDSNIARALARIIPQFAADDIRLSVNQGIVLRFVAPEALAHLYNALDEIGLAKPGFDSLGDITACPGTDTCNLAVTNSTALALELERLIQSEYPTYLERKDLSIKISGCMNSCGQHMAASIGFHGSSIKKTTRIIPAMQVVLGGGVNPDGVGFLANKIIKLPTRRVPEVVRLLLSDFEEQQIIEETYPSYVLRQGNKYFYQLLKHLASADSLKDSDLIDWGQDNEYQQAIGVGECAGVSYDVVSTILHDAKQKVEDAKLTFLQNDLADSIYNSYSAFVIAAKALLLAEDIQCNRHITILSDFQKHFVETKIIQFDGPDFESVVLEINKKEPTESFAESYFNIAEKFVKWADNYRKQTEIGTKAVIESHYLA